MKNLIFLALSLFFIYIPIDGQNVNELKSKAKAGDAQAQYDLAISILNSTTSTNYTEVLSLLRKSSKQGNVEAKKVLKDLTNLGYDAWGDYYPILMYDIGWISDEDKRFFKDRAINGCGEESCKGHKGYFLFLAHSYFHEKDYSKAIYYYKQALSQMKEGNLGKFGDEEFDLWQAWMDAYTMLGYCYEHGYGVAQNYKIALDYYFIGGIYLEKNKYDVSNIKKILHEINNSELTKACLEYGDGMLQFYDGISPAPRGARAMSKPGILLIKLGYYNHAKELIHENLELPKGLVFSSPIDILWTGEMYYKGLGCNKDYNNAYKYFNFIVTSDKFFMSDPHDAYPDIYADACYRLYECYAFGRGTEKNASQAEKYFKLALRYGSTSAIYDDQKRYEISEQ